MSDRGAFVVPVHDLDLAGRSVRFPITPAWLRGALEGCEPQPAGSTGQIDVHLTKTGNDVLVQGQVDAALVVPCARCLEPVEYHPHVELSLLLHPATSAPLPGRRAGAGSGHGEPPAQGKGTKPSPKSDDETEFDARRRRRRHLRGGGSGARLLRPRGNSARIPHLSLVLGGL